MIKVSEKEIEIEANSVAQLSAELMTLGQHLRDCLSQEDMIIVVALVRMNFGMTYKEAATSLVNNNDYEQFKAGVKKEFRMRNDSTTGLTGLKKSSKDFRYEPE